MPVQDKKLILLGKIIKVHGYGGAVMLHPEEYVPEGLKVMEWVFIETEGKPVPFFISSVTEHASGNIVLKFDNYDNSETMTEFIGCRVLLNQEELEDDDEMPAHLILTGFKVYNPLNKYIGSVEKILSLPMQYMLVLRDKEDAEQLIPLNVDWVIGIDKDKKTIIMDLPDGIMNIND